MIDTCIIGLGLIGGSFAKALKKSNNNRVTAIDTDKETITKALEEGVIDGAGDECLASAGLVAVCLYPVAAVEFVRQNAARFARGAYLFDMCGIKQAVVSEIEKILAESGRDDIIYVGCHPMAGREMWGFDASLPSIFEGRSFIITETEKTKKEAVKAAADFAVSAGFERIVTTTPEAHDRIIALTSQLAHIVSSAYVKSPTAQRADGFTAGSFADMTRVAKLNEEMWSELFLENSDHLIFEIRNLIGELTSFHDAIAKRDTESLMELLKHGRLLREQFLREQLNVE